MTSSLSLAAYFSTKLSFHIVYSLQHHVHIRHRRVYDEQKAVVVVQASLPGLRTNAKRASARKYLRAVFLFP